jgi:hypothetical protein
MPGDPHPRAAHRSSHAGAAPGTHPGTASHRADPGTASHRSGHAGAARGGAAGRGSFTHRAGPAGGLALLTPQALVRQAQAGQARARQAIIRQALARQTRGHRVAAHHPAGHQPAGLPAADFREVGLQTGIRLAAQFHAANPDGPGLLVTDPPALPQPRPSHAGRTRGRARVGQRPGPMTGAVTGAVTGRQRRTAQRRAPREPQQTLQTLLRGLAALIVLAIVGLSAFFIIAEESRGPGRESAAAPGAEPALASRAVDPEPLTQGEVFPEPTVRPATSTAGYQVTMTHSDSECRIATVGELGAVLDDYGCAQVVRARLTAPYGGYQVTTGIFNLADEAGAARVSELAGTLVETGRGTFTTLGGSAGDPLAEPLAQVGWHSRGHYLLYCVVARPDGQLVADDDPFAAQITAELVQQYLGEQVVGQRTLDP